MSPSESRNGREADSIPEGGILAALPRARPQRASARRAAARTSTAKRGSAVAKTTTAAKEDKPAGKATTAAKGSRTAATKHRETTKSRAATSKAKNAKTAKATKTATATKPKSARTAGARHAAKPSAKPLEPAADRAPKQGYEPEEELELGKSVNPPSGVELVESVADIIGELANSGVTAGGRLLKDAFSLLRRP